MAYTYVAPADYTGNGTDFTIVGDGGEFFLKVVATDTDDQALIESIIDGYVGFFQNGTRKAVAKIADDYDADTGIELESRPTLVVGVAYDIEFTQARPGKTIFPFSGGLTGYAKPWVPFNYAGLTLFRAELEPFGEPLLPPYFDHLKYVELPIDFDDEAPQSEGIGGYITELGDPFNTPLARPFSASLGDLFTTSLGN